MAEFGAVAGGCSLTEPSTIGANYHRYQLFKLGAHVEPFGLFAHGIWSPEESQLLIYNLEMLAFSHHLVSGCYGITLSGPRTSRQ